MKSIRIFIPGKFQDGYLYGGQLFLVGRDNNVQSVSFSSMFSSNLKYGSEEYNFFKLIFLQNNWLVNSQAITTFHIPIFSNSFKKLWAKYSKIKYIFSIPSTSIRSLQSIDSFPVFDFKIYGMRMFIGNRSGLYEAGFSINNDDSVNLDNPIEKVFDSRITHIAAKAGSIMLSSNSEGLFHGQLLGIGSRVQIKEKAISERSLRSGWTGYDLINYESHSSFDYLKNDWIKTERRNFLYMDETDTRKIKVNEVGVETYKMDELISDLNFKDKITYSFNSSKRCFFYLEDGSLIYSSFIKNKKNAGISLKLGTIKASLNKRPERPISSRIVDNGCILEFFDRVILIQNNTRILLENKPVLSIKTFPGSIRYRNIVAIFQEDGVALHSLFPLNVSG